MKKAEIKNVILIEEINLPNGLKLNIFDLSREIAADTVKVEIAFRADIGTQDGKVFSVISGDTIRADVWHHVAMTYDAAMGADKVDVPSPRAPARHGQALGPANMEIGSGASQNGSQSVAVNSLRSWPFGVVSTFL